MRYIDNRIIVALRQDMVQCQDRLAQLDCNPDSRNILELANIQSKVIETICIMLREISNISNS